MEELKKLEKVQRMVEFMESKGIVTPSSNSSNRFLANLMLFLLEPCGGELGMNDKCCLVSNLMPKLSSAFLEEASLWLSQDLLPKEENSAANFENLTVWLYGKRGKSQNNVQVGVDFQQSAVGNASVSCNRMKEYSLLESYKENTAMVGLDSMQKANSTLEDFCRSYFMFHGLDVSKPQSIFKYLPILSFTETYIYQLDKMNENLLPTPTNAESVSGGKDEKATQVLVSYFSNDPIKPLVTLLECKGLLTGRIKEELRYGEEYWALERKLCFALINKEEILVEDVMKAIHLKSFDYRVLNLLLYQLRGAKVEDLHMEFLSISEFLVEVSDDLYDYEDDVLENNFNILRMFVRIYGASTAPSMLAKCISEAEDKYKTLLESLDPQLSLSYQKRCEEATREGGNVSEHPLGAWTIPTVIPDEEMYRSKLKSDTS